MPSPVTRRRWLATVAVAGLAGCLGGPRATTGVDGARSGSEAAGPPTATEALPLPMAPGDLRERAVSGGPPKDGIPSIDEPSFEVASAVGDRIDPGDPVFGVVGETEVKAYPQAILVHHEIVNDTLDGRPVSVTYCPLTGTAMGFPRGDTTFGVSGRLVNNNLIMYDRATETWWPQVLATAIPGPWNADPSTRSLREFRVVWTTWGRWRERHPETAVLTRDTGHVRNYDVDPYGGYNPRYGYYRPDAPPLFDSLAEDDRFPPKTVVLGARTPAGAVAFHKDRLRTAGRMEGTLGGTPVLAVHDRALDTGYVYRNPEGFSVTPRDGALVGPDGEAHRPDGLPLDRVLAMDAMWFAWRGFYPDSSVHG